MESKLLKEHLSELYGNVTISVDITGATVLNINNTNKSLSISQMLNFPVNTTLGLINDYTNFFGINGYRNLNDSSVDIQRDGYVKASLIMGEKLPKYFIICDKANKPKIIQYYDLSTNSQIGKYINDFRDSFKGVNPININPRRREVTISGINLPIGVVNDYYINYNTGDDINKKILSFVKNNRILLPNILSMDFQLRYGQQDDFNYYFSDDIDLFKYDISDIGENVYVKDNALYMKAHTLLDNNQTDDVSNIPMSFANNDFFVSYLKNGTEIVGLLNDGNSLTLESDIKLAVDDVNNISLTRVSNPSSFVRFRYLGGIEQSEFIRVNSNDYEITLVSDYMPNLIQAGIPFDVGDNNYHIFNWMGSESNVMKAFSKAWNDTSKNAINISCISDGNEILFINDFGGNFDINIQSNKFEKIDHFSEDTNKFTYYKILKDESSNVSSGDILFINKKPYVINGKADNLYIDYSDSKLIKDGNILIIEGINYTDSVESTYVSFSNPMVGVMDISDIVSVKTKFSRNSLNYSDYANLLRPPSIKEGTVYAVISESTIIEYNGVRYETGNTFVGIDIKEYVAIKGLGNIIEQQYSTDPELIQLFNYDFMNSIEDIEDIILSQNDNSDFNGDLPNLAHHTKVADNIFSIDEKARTNEWLIPTKYPYIGSAYSMLSGLTDNNNYSESLSGVYATKFEKNGSIYKTTYRGVEVMSSENLHGYKFVGILNIRSEANYMSGIRSRIIKNEKDKFLLFVMDLPMSDYRFQDRFNFCMSYKAKNSKANAISNKFEYAFQGVEFKGIKIKCSINSIEKDKISFNQKMPIRTLITESNDGVSLLFKNINEDTIISNYGYVADGIMSEEQTKYKLNLSDNNVVIEDYLYVSKINGVIYNVPMHYNEISSIVEFSDMECFQVGSFENDLEALFNSITFSSIKESINLGKSFIENIVVDEQGSVKTSTNIDMQIHQFDNAYSGQYGIPIDTIETHAGSTTPNIFGVYNETWQEQDHTWQDDENSVNILDKYFDKKLNILE